MHTTTRKSLLALLAVLALVLSACAGDDNDPAADGTDPAAGGEETTAAETTADETADDSATAGDDAMGDATVAVASSEFGDILVDGEGRTLYLFTPDDQGDPTCTDDCAAAWPPFEGPAATGDGADGTAVATAEHPSGVTQVTYNGWPLYYFASDAAPGDVNGQGVNDVWFVVGPDGEPVQDANAAGDEDVGY